MKKINNKKTGKRLISVLLIFSLMVSVLPALSPSAFAADGVSGTCGDGLKWSYESDTGKLTITGSGAMDDYAYDPSADPEGRMVPWYDYLGSIKIVVLPEGLTHIGDCSFCDSLITSITIPASVTSIGNGVFYRCRALTEFRVGSGSTSYCAEDGLLFNRDKTEIILCPPGRKGELTIPGTVSRIGEYAFDSTGITAVTMSNGVSEIGDGAFACCFELQSVRIPDSVKKIGDEAFSGCGKLESVVIGDGVTSIGDNAFSDCSSLEEIRLPESLEKIGREAFEACKALTEVTIPENLSFIGQDAFGDCESLQSFIVVPQNPAFYGLEGVLFNVDKTELIRYPEAKAGDYIIPSFVKKLGENAFQRCTGLTGLDMPPKLEQISEKQFIDCRNLKYVRLGVETKSIGALAFANCISLERVTDMDSVTEIGSQAFLGCTSLTEMEFHYGLKNISPGLFLGCSALKTLKLPGSVTTIGSSAFDDCAALEEIEIPPYVTVIERSAFAGCSSLKRVVIPDGVGTIEDSVFFSCSTLTDVSIPESVTSIGQFAFGYCSSLTDLKIPDSVRCINQCAFEGAGMYMDEEKWTNGILYIGDCLIQAQSYITEAKIRQGTRLIADYAFFDCFQMTDVQMPFGIEFIGTGAFNKCQCLKNIIIPRSAEQIGENAFTGCKALEVLTIMREDCQISPSGLSAATVIRGYRGTTAEAFAEDTGLVFEALSGKTGFADVMENVFYEQSVAWAVAHEVTKGTGEYIFSPDQACTRGQVVTFLWRAARCPEPENASTSFTDLKSGAFYEKAVAWAVENGITSGTSKTTFSPDATCTRGHVVTFLWRFRNMPEPKSATTPFTDLKKGAFYEKAVAWAVEEGITKGIDETRFGPDRPCTRGQVVTFLYRAVAK